MAFTAKNYDQLVGLAGLSEQLLKNHFTLYQGYVTNVNKLTDALASMLNDDKAAAPEYAELKRRFGWEYNGARLHELYFENLVIGGKALEMASPLGQKIIRDFGSFEAWQKDFKATGAMRGIGWAILYFDPLTDKLFNVWINEHDLGHLAGAMPLLIMDVFEHAYMLDYQLKKADYLEAFLQAIDWSKAEARLK
jgi:Fe-Mn family superoxide dismutase